MEQVAWRECEVEQYNLAGNCSSLIEGQSAVVFS